jgi:uncharacterized protein YkwD
MPTINSPRKRGWGIGFVLGVVAAFAAAGLLAFAGVAFVTYRTLAPAATPLAAPAAVKEPPKQRAPEPTDEAVKSIETHPASPKAETHNPKKAQPAEERKPEPQPEKKPVAGKKPVAPAEPKAARELAQTFLRQLNTYRKMAGLGLVETDASLSRGCAAHARYLALNPPSGPADAARLGNEEPDRPGFSEEGQRAAKYSMVTIGDPRTTVDHWMAGLGARLELLQADLRSVGLGLEPLPSGGWAVVLDVRRGVGDAVILYPVPGQEDIPLMFSGGAELPDLKAAAGFPVSATFQGQRKVTQVKAELLDDAGKAVDVWLSTPEKPARDKWQRNTVAMIAKAPLQGSQSYRVRISATVDGEAWSKSWTFKTEDDADSKGLWAKKALDKINDYRRLAGLPAVVLDAQLSKGCRAHARYLSLNLGHPSTEGLKAHDENLDLPGASAEGRKAGMASDIAIGDHDPLQGIEAWMATLYHRVPILEPNLKSIGYGCARARRHGWITVMNVGTGRERVVRPRAVFYPAPDQTGVPLNFPFSGEEPNPIPDDATGKAGYPVTAFFPENAPLKSSSAVLTDGAGREVPVWFSSPEVPANLKYPKHQGNTICLISKEPLRPNTTYGVLLRGQLGGQGWQKEWRFTTGGVGPVVGQAAQQALQRLNSYRKLVGLPTVVLDTDLSKGCQAHAEYLVYNAIVMNKKKLPANDEDPSLLGYTAQGKAAARRSDIFSKAPEPATQIDDLMGTFMRRVAALDPQLRRIGAGYSREIGRGWHCVLDLYSGRGGDRIVLFPVKDQDGVPGTGTDRLPDMKGLAGYPISVTFPSHVKLQGGRGTLTDAHGKAVETLLSTPERPLASQQRNTVALHPRAPLQPGQTYTVMLSVIVNGLEWRETWQFTTE